jgi:hypothetical protein
MLFACYARPFKTDLAHSFLFLDVDPSQAMNLEARVKEHIDDLQHHIKASVLLDVGKVRDPTFFLARSLGFT